MGLKFDDGKLLMGLVDPYFVEDVAKVLTFGAGGLGAALEDLGGSGYLSSCSSCTGVDDLSSESL